MQLITQWFWLRHAPMVAKKGVFIGKGSRSNDPAAELNFSHQEIALLASRVGDRINNGVATNSVLAKELIEEKNRLPDCLLITSTLRRARETAAALVDAEPQTYKAMRVMRVAAFDEQNFGVLEGKEYDKEYYTHEQRALWDAPDTYRPPDGESFTDLINRVACAVERIESALHRIAGRQSGSESGSEGSGEDGGAAAKVSIIVVAHAGTIRAALAHALAKTLNAHSSASATQALTFAIDTLSCTRIDTYRDKALDSSAGKNKSYSLIGCVNARWGFERKP